MNGKLKDLILEGTEATPFIHCCVDEGKVEISGRSLLNDSEVVFVQIASWVGHYIKEKTNLTFHFNFDYINSSSNYHLLTLLKKTSRFQGLKISIDWYYEDEDIHDIGLDYQELLPDLTFNFFQV